VGPRAQGFPVDFPQRGHARLVAGEEENVVFPDLQQAVDQEARAASHGGTDRKHTWKAAVSCRLGRYKSKRTQDQQDDRRYVRRRRECEPAPERTIAAEERRHPGGDAGEEDGLDDDQGRQGIEAVQPAF
jgi:hypothetical protein